MSFFVKHSSPCQSYVSDAKKFYMSHVRHICMSDVRYLVEGHVNYRCPMQTIHLHYVSRPWPVRNKTWTFSWLHLDRTALSALQPKLYSMFCALFLKIALSAAELMSFGQLEAAIWHRTIIRVVPSKISVTPTSQR